MRLGMQVSARHSIWKMLIWHLAPLKLRAAEFWFCQKNTIFPKKHDFFQKIMIFAKILGSGCGQFEALAPSLFTSMPSSARHSIWKMLICHPAPIKLRVAEFWFCQNITFFPKKHVFFQKNTIFVQILGSGWGRFEAYSWATSTLMPPSARHSI